MLIFRAALMIGWIVLAWVSGTAVAAQGMIAGDVFFASFKDPWLAQFSTDFTLHLLAMAVWVGWREHNKVWGVSAGLLCIMGGGLFSLAYILAASFKAENRFDYLLLGCHRQG
jgi:hypothetical protein